MRGRLLPGRSAWTLSFLAIAFITVPQASAEAQTKVSPQLSAAIQQIETMTAAELAKDNLGSVTVGIISGPELIWAKSGKGSGLENLLSFACFQTLNAPDQK